MLTGKYTSNQVTLADKLKKKFLRTRKYIVRDRKYIVRDRKYIVRDRKYGL